MNNSIAMNLRKRVYDLVKKDGIWFAILKNNRTINMKTGEGLQNAVRRKTKGFFNEAKAMTLLLQMQGLTEARNLVYVWEPEPISNHTIPTWCEVHTPDPIKDQIQLQWLEQY